MLARIGHALGSLVIVFWRRSKREEYPISVHLLVSSGSWHCGLLAAISLEICCKKNWRLIFHDDGSITESQRKRIEKTLPGVHFVPRRMAEVRMSEVLKDFPKCSIHRSQHNFFLKLFDVHPFAASGKYMVMDSDVIFFRTPKEIISWAESDAAEIFYNGDAQEKYCNPRTELEKSFEIPLWEKFNGGLVLMQSAAMNLHLAESLFEKFEDKAHHPQFFEQTLYCLMSSAWGHGGALPPTYEINWGYLRSPGAVCRHYVGAFKHDLLYIEGVSILFLRLLPSLIKNAVTSVFANFGKTTRVLTLSALIFGLTAFAWHYFKTNEAFLKLQQTILGSPFRAIKTPDGIPRFTAKLSNGAPVTIAFIGGSITQNAGEGGFVTTLKEHLTSEFLASDIRIINAGMASTDSAWGAKRIGRDILELRPDLVFVEFAVNDGERDSAPDMERIVRKIHDSNPEAEVVFIYTTSESALKKLRKGVFPKAILEHGKVANHYGVPSVTFGADLVSLISLGQWKWRDFSNDACHPTKQGYDSYNRDFFSAFGHILKESRGKGSEQYPEPIFDKLELYPPKITPEPVAK
jgi:lysophospholipase L1-like esterase